MANHNNKTQELLATNPFLALLAQLDGGRAVGAAADKYPLLVEAVHSTGIKGKLTLDITVAPEGSGEVRTVKVVCKLNTKLPEKPTRETIFFVTEDMRLSRTDPLQMEIPGTEDKAAAPAAPVSAKSSASWPAQPKAA